MGKQNNWRYFYEKVRYFPVNEKVMRYFTSYLKKVILLRNSRYFNTQHYQGAVWITLVWVYGQCFNPPFNNSPVEVIDVHCADPSANIIIEVVCMERSGWSMWFFYDSFHFTASCWVYWRCQTPTIQQSNKAGKLHLLKRLKQRGITHECMGRLHFTSCLTTTNLPFIF